MPPVMIPAENVSVQSDSPPDARTVFVPVKAVPLGGVTVPVMSKSAVQVFVQRFVLPPKLADALASGMRLV